MGARRSLALAGSIAMPSPITARIAALLSLLRLGLFIIMAKLHA